MNTGAAAVLEIRPLEKQIIRDYIPGTRYRDSAWHHRGWSHGRHHYHDPFYFDDPPMILEEPEAHYEAVLFTLPHYRKAWAGDLITRGPTGMSFDEVAANYGRELVENALRRMECWPHLCGDGTIGIFSNWFIMTIYGLNGGSMKLTLILAVSFNNRFWPGNGR
jgi:hypothetical protein